MKKLVISFITAMILFLSMPSAMALTIATTPSEIDLNNGFVFWMTLPEEAYSDYPQSGLYFNGELVYTVDVDHGWWWGRLYFSEDAMTFLFLPMAAGNQTIRFYLQGVLVHEYKISEIIKGGESALIQPEGLNTFSRWDYGEHRYYNRENNILRVLTSEYKVITFDLSTGLIIGSYEIGSIVVIILCVSAIIILIIIIIRQKRLNRQ